jgi:archaellum biogenesis protein FlaJ (TadC family)
MVHALVNAFISGLGILWMRIRHPNEEIRKQKLSEKFNGSYRKAGNPIAITIIILIFVLELVVEFI